MSVVKLEIRIPEVVKVLEAFTSNRRQALESLSREITVGVSHIINQLMMFF
jgi:hypothetical protein